MKYKSKLPHLIAISKVLLLISTGCSSFSHQNENKELPDSVNERTSDIIGDKVIHSYTVGDETLTVFNGTTIVEGRGNEKRVDCFFIKYNTTIIGPFKRFFNVDNNNNMGDFTIKEINGKLFFTVFATKPVDWGEEGFSDSIAILGYKDNIYYPYHDGRNLYYDFTPISHEVVYLKKTNEIWAGRLLLYTGRKHFVFKLFKGAEPVSNEYEKIIPLKIDTNDDIYYYGEPHHDLDLPPYHSANSVICKNEKVIFETEVDFKYKEDITITESNNFYYIGRNGRSLFRNDERIVIINETNGYKITNYTISNNETNIAYTIIDNDGNFYLYKNFDLVDKTKRSNEFIIGPIFSPDGLKLYYLNAFIINNSYWIHYIKGPGIPPAISGPYLRPSWWSVNFSNDSKYVAYVLEGFERGMEGVCIVLNSQFYGPYRSTRNNHFSDDSKQYIYQYKDSDDNWVENVIDLQ